MHMIKAYHSAIKDGSMTFSSGLDRMFGTVGFYQYIQSKSIEEILQNCDGDRKLYMELIKKIYLYDDVPGK